MPVTIRGKQEPPSDQKDAASTPPPSTGKVEPKNKVTGAGKGAEVTRSLTERTSKSSDASKVTGTSSTPISSARQRARERRRGRVEVSPEPDSNSPDPEASAAGRIKNLAGFWSTPKDEVQVVRKKRLEVSERKEKAESSDSDSPDSDSDLEGLKRSHEGQPSSETIEVEVEKGRAKSIANMWQNRKDEELPAKRTPFKLDLQTEEPSVFENEPVVLEGVVRSDDRAVMDDVIIGRPGRIKNLVVNFGTNTQSKQDSSDEDDVKEDRAVRNDVVVGRPGRIKNLVSNYGTNTQSKNQDTSDEEEESTEKHSSVATTKTTEEDIERGKVRNVRERWKKRQQKKSKTGSDSESENDESSATEDTPQRSSRGVKKDRVIEKAKISNLRERWNRQDGSGSNKDGGGEAQRRSVPNRLHSLVTAKEYGVFENEPTVRDDVVRADDEQPDIISVDKTQKMRRMWTMMDKEVMKDKEPVEKVVKPAAKKKDDKRNAEEEAAVQVVKPTKKVLGRLHGAKEESPKPKEETSKPKKGHRVKGRGEAEADQKDQQEPEVKGKQLQRAFTIATVADVKPSAPKSPSLMRYSRKKVA